MIHHIDVSSVLRRSVCELYSNLVTRPTGAAVRAAIEEQLAASPGRLLTVIDFTHVGLLDFSCADEIVARLLLRANAGALPHDDYFVFRGVSEHHLDAIEAVLERHGLALILEEAPGQPRVLGTLGEREREAWEAMVRLGRAAERDLAEALDISRNDAAAVLDALCRRRLLFRLGGDFAAVGIQ